MKDGRLLMDFGNSIKSTYIKGHHNMGRNILVTDSRLYFVTKKLHRLIQIDLKEAIGQANAGVVHNKDQETGTVLAFEVADFCVDSDDRVYVLTEDSTV